MSLTCGRSVVFSRYSTNKTDCQDITEILLKVALNTIILTHEINADMEVCEFDMCSLYMIKFVRLLYNFIRGLKIPLPLNIQDIWSTKQSHWSSTKIIYGWFPKKIYFQSNKRIEYCRTQWNNDIQWLSVLQEC